VENPPSSFLVCRACYARHNTKRSSFHAISSVENKAAHFIISSYLAPQDIGRLSFINTEWHGLMASNVADAVLWMPFCRNQAGRVLTNQECLAYVEKRSYSGGMLPHKEFFLRKVFLRHNFDAAAKCLSCSNISFVLISSSTLMQKYGSLAARGKKLSIQSNNSQVSRLHLVALKGLIGIIRRFIEMDIFSIDEKSIRDIDVSVLMETLTCATGALMNAALIGENFRDEIIKLKGIDCFVHIVGRYELSDRLSKYACGALWNLCLNSRYCRHTIGKYIKYLVARLQSFWSNETSNASSYLIATVSSCAGIIAACCSENYHENQVEIIEAGGIETLLLVISKAKGQMETCKKIVLNCSAAIRNTLTKQPKAQKIFRESGGVRLMMSLLNPEFFWGEDDTQGALQTIAAVLVNSTNEDKAARDEVDSHMLCNYILSYRLKSSNAILYAGILQNITCGGVLLSPAACNAVVECCDVYAKRSSTKAEFVNNNLTPLSSNESYCIVRLMCALRNLLSNPNAWLELNLGHVKKTVKYVKRNCVKDARYHACKILELLEKQNNIMNNISL
jgi:hypothetical protein